MELQTCPKPDSCFVTSVAMAIDMDVKDLIELMQLDRNYILEDFNLFFARTMIPYRLVRYDAFPVGDNGPYWPGGCLGEVMPFGPGVLIGINASGRPHAMAWDGLKLYDPAGEGKILEAGDVQMQITHFLALVRIRP